MKKHNEEIIPCQPRSVDSDNSQPSRSTSTRNPFKKNVVHRGMERIRKSFRESFRRRTSRNNHSGSNIQLPSGSSNVSGSNHTGQWVPDEAAVRNGTCSFNVKYLGGIEVFESRGMQICEGAMKLLRAQKRRPVKAILYVSGDGLRVVDQESNRGLIVDQTIEKVSFCAPDRNIDKGFAYICRDGTSRRWMCHGFVSTKETGERLSHAVGCAFAICLERKKKRDSEAAAAIQAAAGFPPVGSQSTSTSGFTLNGLPNFHSNPIQTSSFDRYCGHGSFRRLSITERLQDPQTAIVNDPPLPSTKAVTTRHDFQITAKPRPVSNPLLFQRQGSLRAPELSSSNGFKRQFSLRSYPDSPARKDQTVQQSAVKSEPIYEDEEVVWPNSKIDSECNTFENAPYDSTRYNGFRQSLSYNGTPSVNETSSYGCSHSMVHSPLHVKTTQSMYFDAPRSLNDNSNGVKSKADEWLEQTLRSSLSFSSNTTHSPMFKSEGCPSTPMSRSVNDCAPHTPIKFNADFSRYELPPIIESYTPSNEVSDFHSMGNEQIDVFGQTVFNPTPSNHLSNVDVNQTSGSSERSKGDAALEYDPFDVTWSEVVVNTASSYQQTQPTRSTNPFHSQLAT